MSGQVGHEAAQALNSTFVLRASGVRSFYETRAQQKVAHCLPKLGFGVKTSKKKNFQEKNVFYCRFE